MTTTIANALIAFCSLTALILNIILLKSDRKDRANESWHKARNARKKFWEMSRRAYKKYQEKNPTLTNELQNLINQAGIPPNAPGNAKSGKIAWEASNKKKLTPEQAHIYAFAQSVYPERIGEAYSQADTSVLDRSDFDQLDEARRELDYVFMIWGKRLKYKKFVKLYRHGKDDCVLLCWYDLALIRWTHDEGLGDPTIYKLGYEYTKG